MFNQNALKAYQQADQDFLVNGANGHQLVEILFTELLASLDRAHMAVLMKDASARSAGVSKALSIIYVLSSSLDFEKGGEVAQSLAELYEWARQNIIASNNGQVADRLQMVRNSLGEIADAWTSIADKVA